MSVSKPFQASMLRRLFPWIWMLCSLAALCPGPASAAWPDKPIRLVLGYPPGGGTDAVARLLADRLSRSLGQPVIVENHPGASGIIGAQTVARADPDGYTLFFATAASLTGALVTVKDLPYDPLKDFVPITLVGHGPFILVAYPGFPPNTLQELVAYAKASPDKVNYASPGISTANYFLCELLNLTAGIHTTQVPYKGSAALINDLIGGQVQFTLDTPGTTLPLIRSGKLKAIALLDSHRLSRAPDIPTSVEAGYPNIVGGSWYGLLAPAKTPKAIVDRVQGEVATALKSPELRKALEDRDVLANGDTPAEFAQFIQAEAAKWQDITARLGIQPQ